MSRVIVTGAEGFIGYAVVDQLKQTGINVAGWTGPPESLALFAEPADIVIHLAASARHAELTVDERSDVGETEAILEYCRMHNAKCILASTAGVYSSGAEEYQDEEAPTGPVSAYATSKLRAEQSCRVAYTQHGVPCTVLRLFNVYGPGQRPPFLIPHVVDSIAADKPFKLKMPKAIRDFVFVQDVASAFAAAVVSQDRNFRVINIGSGRGTCISDLVTMVARLLGKSPVWSISGKRSSEVHSSVADIRRARSELKWQPAVALEEGLKVTCESR